MSYILYYYRNGFYSEAVRGFFRFVDSHKYVQWLRIKPSELPDILKKFDLGLFEDYMCCFLYRDTKYPKDSPQLISKIGPRKEALIQKLSLDPTSEYNLEQWFNYAIEKRRKKLQINPSWDPNKALEQEIIGDLRETTKNTRQQEYDKIIRKYAYNLAIKIEDFFDDWLRSHKNECIKWARANYNIDNNIATMFDKMTYKNFDGMLNNFYSFEFKNWFDAQLNQMGKKADRELQENYRFISHEFQIPYELLENHINPFDIRNYMWENVNSRYHLKPEYYRWLASMKAKIMPWHTHKIKAIKQSQVKPKPVVVPLPKFMKKK